VATAAAVDLLRPDVIHFQAPFNRRFDPVLLRYLRRRVGLVWTAHDVLPHERTAADEQRFRRIYRTVDAVVIHVEPADDALRDLAGVEGTVIQHPTPLPVIDANAEEARAALALPQGERLLAAVGFVRAYKGYALLAEVWEQLGERAPLLLLMGEQLAGAEHDVLSRLGRSPRTIMRLGYASERDLQLAVRAADALLLPYSAGSDSGVLHLARALGVPVIASDAPHLAASARATSAGVVVPRDADAWANAVIGPLPPPPPPPASSREIGEAHLALYERVLAARRDASRST
jgi:glycosyltransferase involved in cell wall biosynthesis